MTDEGVSPGEDGRRRCWWGHAPSRDDVPATIADLASITPQSKALAKELKSRGFRFAGPTTAYAAMQACGIVNDHLTGCTVRDEVEAERRSAIEALR